MIFVTCAVIINEGKILVTQRGPGMSLPGKWEFPGGKVEQGETPEACIVREIKEELNIVIQPIEQMTDSFYDYGTIQITLLPFLARYISGEIILTEHQNYNWLLRSELESLDWAAADKSLVNLLKSMNL